MMPTTLPLHPGVSVSRRSRKACLPPETMIHIGQQLVDAVSMSVVDFDDKHNEPKILTKAEGTFVCRSTSTVTWLNITGLHEPKVIKVIGDHYGLHPLIQEDILQTDQRPKVEA